ncbi:MAG: D-tyrosyl-tRNA(Tyr) deacylase [Candidatus Adiutrix sp.]|jgi:D-tyrosyl-tRNA(Tyr) deacylase|nr:D-tyrosyl-tRNA(Tyr) deacylase [Candidatus Adiutrix sp.]
MRILLQRVTKAAVRVEGEEIGSIGSGLLIFLGVAEGDTKQDADWLVEKLAGLRVFYDEGGKMNLSVREVGGELLVVSQFTLYGDCRRGRRPSFDKAAAPALADELYEYFKAKLASLGLTVASGRFAAHMEVELLNDGPVTFIIDSPEK